MRIKSYRQRPVHRVINAVTLAIYLANTGLFQTALAEEIIKRSPVSELEQSNFDKNIEDRITRDVKAYLGHDFFIIRAGSLLENTQIFDRKEKLVPAPVPPQVLAPPPQQQPVAPQQPAMTPEQNDAVSQMELETEDGISQKSVSEILGVETPLPGLPVPDTVFEQMQKQEELKNQRKKTQKTVTAPPPPAPPVQQQYVAPQPPPPPPMEKEVTETLRDSRVEVKKLSLKIILDEHISPEQEMFIRQIAIEKSGLSFIRGDELQISRSKFPGASVLDPKPEPPKEEEKKPEPVVEPPIDTKVEVKPEEPAEPAWLTLLKQYWPVLLVLLALAIYMAISRSKKRKAEAAAAAEPKVIEIPEITKKFDKLIAEMSRKEEVLAENRLQAIKEEVMSMAVTDYGIINGQIAEWLTSGSEEELTKVATLHHLLGQGTFTSLFRKLITSEKLVALAAKSQEIKEQTPQEEFIGLAEGVYQLLIQRRYDERTKINQEMRPFEFLEQLNDEQILYLLNDENLKVRALVYSQLPSDRAAGLLKRAVPADRTKLATEISKFSQLPVLAFKDVANRLAKKAVNVPSFANIEVDGVDLLINMLDHMELADETTMLTSLQKDNPQLFYQIKKVYVSFNDLIRLPALALKNVLREIEREKLATALFDMDESFRNVLYESLLERPRAMLQVTIKNMSQPDAKAMSEAKRFVARKAREMLKAGAIQLAPQQAPAATAPSAPKPAAKTA